MGKIWIPGGGGGADLDLVTASASDIRNGKVIVDQDGNPLTGTMAEKAAATYTPGTANQIISANQYLAGAQTIKGDSNLVASKIKKGVTIFGITGTWEGYVTSPLYLYNKGTWSNLQTTGWQGEGSEISGSGRNFTEVGITDNAYYATVQCCLKQTFDISNYKYIKITTGKETGYSTEKTAFVGISKTYNIATSLVDSSSGSFNSTLTKVASGTGTVILDVSSLSGAYYIYIGHLHCYGSYASSYGGVMVTQVYLTNS